MLSKMMNENVEEKYVRPLTEIRSIDGKYGLSPWPAITPEPIVGDHDNFWIYILGHRIIRPML